MLFHPFRRPPHGMSLEAQRHHPHYRRFTPVYRARRKLVRDMWIGLGLLMTLLPPAGVMVIAMLGTFAAFLILDESEQQ